MSIQVTKRPYNYSFSGNPVHYELYSGTASIDSTIYFEVKLKFKNLTGSSILTIVTLPYYPTDGYAKIDLAEVLDGLLDWNLPVINANPTYVWGASSQTGHFYIEFREISAANGDPTWDTSEEEYQRFVLKGGLNDFKWQ